VRYLVSASKNFAIDCDSEELSRAQELAIGAIIFYPIGVLLLCASLLYSARGALLYQVHTPFSRALGFLCSSFQPAFFFFDLLEMAKKLLLVGFASLISRGSLGQLVAGWLVSLLFLILHIQSHPYRKKTDNVVATSAQLMLTMFFFWCTLLQTGALGDPDDVNNNLSGSGSAVTISMLFACVFVLAFASSLFVLEHVTEGMRRLRDEVLRARWSVCTLEPPWVDWKPDCSYSCFLSHYKAEAAMDARFMHDVMRKMLRCPVFLDSSSLADLRLLIRDGVDDSDVIVLLGTKGVLTRPWCLLEIMHATRKQTPIVLMNIQGRGFSIDEMRSFANDFENEIERLNPQAVPLLFKELGTTDLSEIKQALLKMLDGFANAKKTLVWNPNAGDEELIASLKDLIESMADETGRKVSWSDRDWGRGGSISRTMNAFISKTARHSARHSAGSQADQSRKRHKRKDPAKLGATPIAFIAAHHSTTLGEARVLQTELAVQTRRTVITNTPDNDAIFEADRSQVVIFLLTAKVLEDPSLLYVVFRAAQEKKPIVPIYLAGHGYDFAAAEHFLANLESSLTAESFEVLIEALGTASVQECKSVLHSTIPNLIAVNWQPDSSQNLLEAMVKKVTTRLPLETLNVKSTKQGNWLKPRSSSIELVKTEAATIDSMSSTV